MDPVEKRLKQEEVSEHVKYIIDNLEYLNDSHCRDLLSAANQSILDRQFERKEQGLMNLEDDIQAEIKRIKDGRDFDLTYEYVDDNPEYVYLIEPDGEDLAGVNGIKEEKALEFLKTIPTGITQEDIYNLFFKYYMDIEE